MAPPTLPGPDETQDDAQWRTAGERIQNLLDASSSGGAVARERAEQLVREVTDLYGAVLERMTNVALAADPGLADRFAAALPGLYRGATAPSDPRAMAARGDSHALRFEAAGAQSVRDANERARAPLARVVAVTEPDIGQSGHNHEGGSR